MGLWQEAFLVAASNGDNDDDRRTIERMLNTPDGAMF